MKNKKNALPFEVMFHQAQDLYVAGNITRAKKIFQEIQKKYPNVGPVLSMLSSIAVEEKQYEHALQLVDQAIQIDPSDAVAHNNRGNVLSAMQQTEAAKASFLKALSLNPEYIQAHYNLGVVLEDQQQWDQAVARYHYVLAHEPGFALAHNNIGVVFRQQGKKHEALSCFDRAIQSDPRLAKAYQNRANTRSDLGHYEEAIADYRRARQLDVEVADLGTELLTHLHLADWESYAEKKKEIETEALIRNRRISPFTMLSISDRPEIQQLTAQQWAKQYDKQTTAIEKTPKRSEKNKIKIGYFSGDFRSHPVAALMVQVFAQHNREKFEVYAFAYCPLEEDAVSHRIASVVDHWVNVRDKTAKEIAEQARRLAIDIAIDLSGYTEYGRPEIFAERVALSQISYLGYLGTLGSSSVDYLIADQILITQQDAQFYNEKIIYLPWYQANDQDRPRPTTAPDRNTLGLSERGVVYASFNHTYKINPEVFGDWMDILRAVPDSVLMLLAANDRIASHLRQAAANAGIDARRLLFVPRKKYEDYLAQYHLVDLFLDTSPYNAGTTASDALWMGVPVLTKYGKTFAGRMAASLLHAVGVPELIAQSKEDYIKKAIQLGTDKVQRDQLKRKITASRASAALYDTPRFTANLERAYETIDQQQADGLVESFVVELV